MELQIIAKIVGYIGLFMLFLLCVEFIYSHIKKDGVYETKATASNIVTGLVFIKFISTKMDGLIFGLLFYLFYTILEYSQPHTFSIKELLVSIVLIDFTYYISHRLHHKYAFLWMMHSVHHSDHKFNLSTYLRASVLQQLYGALLFIPAMAIGMSPGNLIAGASIVFMYQFICHSPYIRFPKFFGHVLYTPQMHKIHHDQEIKHQMSNYGSLFSLWDKLFGTYVDTIDTFTPGIKGYKQDNFIMTQVDPVLEYWRKFKKKNI